jgi:hypothetical protein
LTVGSTTATDFPGRFSCVVRTAKGKEHPSEVIPCRTADVTPQGEHIKREILVFFTPPLPTGEDAQAPYAIFLRDCLRGTMNGLQEKGEDLMGTTVLRTATPAKRVDLVLFVPEDYPPLHMLSVDGSHPGQPMDEAELTSFSVPYGFRALGWTGHNVPPNAFLRVKFIRLPAG